MNSRRFHSVFFVLAMLLGSAVYADNLAESDQEFLEQAAQNGHAELSASRLALNKARNPQVRAFAQHMIDDHTRVDEELRSLAASKNYSPPQEPSLLQKGKEKILSAMGDESFDRRYVNQMGVDAHEETVALFEKAAREARDPEVKAFAVKHLPSLREHLQKARELKAVVDPEAATSGAR